MKMFGVVVNFLVLIILICQVVPVILGAVEVNVVAAILPVLVMRVLAIAITIFMMVAKLICLAMIIIVVSVGRNVLQANLVKMGNVLAWLQQAVVVVVVLFVRLTLTTVGNILNLIVPDWCGLFVVVLALWIPTDLAKSV